MSQVKRCSSPWLHALILVVIAFSPLQDDHSSNFFNHPWDWDRVGVGEDIRRACLMLAAERVRDLQLLHGPLRLRVLQPLSAEPSEGIRVCCARSSAAGQQTEGSLIRDPLMAMV